MSETASTVATLALFIAFFVFGPSYLLFGACMVLAFFWWASESK